MFLHVSPELLSCNLSPDLHFQLLGPRAWDPGETLQACRDVNVLLPSMARCMHVLVSTGT